MSSSISESILDQLPSVEEIIETILIESDNAFRDVSLVVDNELLQRAAVIIDSKQIRRIVTVPGNKVFYEFIKSAHTDGMSYCLPHHCECHRYVDNISYNRPVLLCEHLLAIALCNNMNIKIPVKKVHLVDVLNSF